MNNLIKLALETFPNFVIIDDKGIIVYMNEVYAKLLGIKKEFAIGKRVDYIIPNTKLFNVLLTGKEDIGSVMTLYDHVKKEEVSLVCNRIPIKSEGKVIGALAATTISDIFDVAKLYKEIELIKSENKKYKKKLREIQQVNHPLDRIIGISKSVQNIKKTIFEYADSNLTILISGETGVGKEVFAKAIHQTSYREPNNYIKINCAAIPDNLFESELFGYESGAFTGSSKNGKLGKFELANKGTLLLDEIGDIPISFQVKLLRVLQEKEFEKVGGIKTIPFNARLICCTNQNLEQMILDKKFRQDLYYRINIVEIPIPPLRERMEDIEPLCYYFINKINFENSLQITKIEDEVFEAFNQYNWPGNIRELEHVIERASITCKGEILTKSNFKFFIDKKHTQIAASLPESDKEFTLRDKTQKTEKEAIIKALRQTRGNKTKAAQLLNIDRSGLYGKLKKFNIQ